MQPTEIRQDYPANEAFFTEFPSLGTVPSSNSPKNPILNKANSPMPTNHKSHNCKNSPNLFLTEMKSKQSQAISQSNIAPIPRKDEEFPALTATKPITPHTKAQNPIDGLEDYDWNGHNANSDYASNSHLSLITLLIDAFEPALLQIQHKPNTSLANTAKMGLRHVDDINKWIKVPQLDEEVNGVLHELDHKMGIFDCPNPQQQRQRQFGNFNATEYKEFEFTAKDTKPNGCVDWRALNAVYDRIAQPRLPLPELKLHCAMGFRIQIYQHYCVRYDITNSENETLKIIMANLNFKTENAKELFCIIQESEGKNSKFSHELTHLFTKEEIKEEFAIKWDDLPPKSQDTSVFYEAINARLPQIIDMKRMKNQGKPRLKRYARYQRYAKNLKGYGISVRMSYHTFIEHCVKKLIQINDSDSGNSRFIPIIVIDDKTESVHWEKVMILFFERHNTSVGVSFMLGKFGQYIPTAICFDKALIARQHLLLGHAVQNREYLIELDNATFAARGIIWTKHTSTIRGPNRSRQNKDESVASPMDMIQCTKTATHQMNNMNTNDIPSNNVPTQFSRGLYHINEQNQQIEQMKQRQAQQRQAMLNTQGMINEQQSMSYLRPWNAQGQAQRQSRTGVYAQDLYGQQYQGSGPNSGQWPPWSHVQSNWNNQQSYGQY